MQTCTCTRSAVSLGEHVTFVILKLFETLSTDSFVIENKCATFEMSWSGEFATLSEAISTTLMTKKVIISIEFHATNNTGGGIGQEAFLGTSHQCRIFYVMAACCMKIKNLGFLNCVSLQTLQGPDSVRCDRWCSERARG